eukprot:1182218-Prorocentrum_minimum.AAC.3
MDQSDAPASGYIQTADQVVSAEASELCVVAIISTRGNIKQIGIFSRRANQMQDGRVYSHDGPIGCAPPGIFSQLADQVVSAEASELCVVAMISMSAAIEVLREHEVEDDVAAGTADLAEKQAEHLSLEGFENLGLAHVQVHALLRMIITLGFPDQPLGFPDRSLGFPDRPLGFPDRPLGLPDQYGNNKHA